MLFYFSCLSHKYFQFLLFILTAVIFFSVHVITLCGVIDALFVRRKIAGLYRDIKDLQALLLSPSLSHYNFYNSL